MEQGAVKDAGVMLFELMSRAGQQVFHQACRQWPHARYWWVVTGNGNNGGDGYIVARLAQAAGIKVTVLPLVEPFYLRGDAATAYAYYQAEGGLVSTLSRAQDSPDLIIDALLGTGCKGALGREAQRYIRFINSSTAPVLSIDMPSGVEADTGHIESDAVHADMTVCLVGLKLGLLTGRGPDVAGKIVVEDLEVSPLANSTPWVSLLSWSYLYSLFPNRRVGAHKGEAGKLLVAGGQPGMSGAIRLAGEAALRSGTGLVRLVSHEQHFSTLNLTRPELMTATFSEFDEWSWAKAIVLGPGLGRSAWSHSLYQAALTVARKNQTPLVLDADGLWWLSQSQIVINTTTLPWVLTPHSGEAAHLLGCSIAEVEQDRRAAVLALQQRYGGVIVLKGAGTLIADQDTVKLCQYGNNGMASGGMGDVLSGIIGGFMAQGLTPMAAATLGVGLHSLAGDLAARQGARGLVASDLLVPLKHLLNQDDTYDPQYSHCSAS